MNGYEATAAIRSLPGEKGKLPIVAMTARSEEHTSELQSPS